MIRGYVELRQTGMLQEKQILTRLAITDMLQIMFLELICLVEEQDLTFSLSRLSERSSR